MISEQRTYTIPLRKAFQDKPPQRRAKTAVKAVKTFLSKHMKADEANIKLSSSLNEVIWANGARNPPAKITVVADPIESTITVRTEDEHRTPAQTTEESTEDKADEDNNDDETTDTSSQDDHDETTTDEETDEEEKDE